LFAGIGGSAWQGEDSGIPRPGRGSFSPEGAGLMAVCHNEDTVVGLLREAHGLAGGYG
jgi:hypothetical protein